MKFLAMHITNQKLYLNVFTLGSWQNILMENVWHKRKIYNFDPYKYTIRLMTSFVVHGQLFDWKIPKLKC